MAEDERERPGAAPSGASDIEGGALLRFPHKSSVTAANPVRMASRPDRSEGHPASAGKPTEGLPGEERAEGSPGKPAEGLPGEERAEGPPGEVLTAGFSGFEPGSGDTFRVASTSPDPATQFADLTAETETVDPRKDDVDVWGRSEHFR